MGSVLASSPCWVLRIRVFLFFAHPCGGGVLVAMPQRVELDDVCGSRTRWFTVLLSRSVLTRSVVRESMLKYIVIFLVVAFSPLSHAEVVARWVDTSCVQVETVLLKSGGAPVITRTKAPLRSWSCDRQAAGLRCISVATNDLKARDMEVVLGRMTKGSSTRYVTDAWSANNSAASNVIALRDDGVVVSTHIQMAGEVSWVTQCIGKHTIVEPKIPLPSNSFKRK